MDKEQEGMQDRFNKAFDEHEKNVYNNKAKVKRTNHQFQRLAGKINYMNRLTSMGRKFGRNTPCPCKSGLKFKKCCIVNHDHNCKKLNALQLAMTKLHVRIMKYGFKLGRTGVGV